MMSIVKIQIIYRVNKAMLNIVKIKLAFNLSFLEYRYPGLLPFSSFVLNGANFKDTRLNIF